MDTACAGWVVADELAAAFGAGICFLTWGGRARVICSGTVTSAAAASTGPAGGGRVGVGGTLASAAAPATLVTVGL